MFAPLSNASALARRGGGGAVPRSDKGGNDAVERPQLLCRRLAALKEVAEVADHAGTLVPRAQKAAAVELLLEMTEEAQQLLLGGRLGMPGDQQILGRFVDRRVPFI